MSILWTRSRFARPVVWPILAIILIVSLPPLQAQDWIYHIRPGDNLWSLTEKYLPHMGYVHRLQALNKITDPYHLPPGSTLHIPLAWMRTIPAAAKVVSVHGDIRYISAGTSQPHPLNLGDTVPSGAQIMTGADSNATLVFRDGSRLVVQSESLLRLEKLRAYANTDMVVTRTHLRQGRSEARVQAARGSGSRFEIRTPAAVTAVRGTDYRVSADDAGRISRTEVLAGKVGVTGTHRTRLISAGFGTVAATGKAPLPAIQLLAAPDVTGLPPLVERVPVGFALAPLDGAEGYRVQVAANEDFTPLLFDRTFPSHLVRGIELPDGDYLLRIRGVDKHGLEGLNGQRRFTLNARPEPPFLVEPAADAGVLEEQPVFVWSSQDSAVGYHFQLAQDTAFHSPLVDQPAYSDHRLQSPLKLAPGTYYWRVATLSTSEGRGPFSDIQAFRRPPPGPAVEEPEVSEQTLNVRWRAGQPGQTYEFQFAGDGAFGDILAQGHTSQASATIERPKGGSYFMRVHIIDVDGYVGPYGPVQRIEIPYKIPSWVLMVVPAVLALVL